MDAHGKVLSQWTGRTVIRSCAKLAYPHAQAMIDGSYAAREGEEPPVLLEAPHTWPQVLLDDPEWTHQQSVTVNFGESISSGAQRT